MSILAEIFRRKIAWAVLAVVLGVLAYAVKESAHTRIAREEGGPRSEPRAGAPSPEAARSPDPQAAPRVAAPAAPATEQRAPAASAPDVRLARERPQATPAAAEPGPIPAAAVEPPPVPRRRGVHPLGETKGRPRVSNRVVTSDAAAPAGPKAEAVAPRPAATESVSVLEQDCGTASLDPSTGEITYTRPPSPDGTDICTLRVKRTGEPGRKQDPPDPDRE